MATPPEIVVIVAGLPRKGKSTALNNIFGVQFPTGLKAGSVTSEVSRRVVINNEVSMAIFDTPGLASLDKSRNERQFLDEMSAAAQGKNYILLYCHSISPNNTLTNADVSIMKTLYSTIGCEVWRRCVLLLTFSDIACKAINSEDDYIKHVKGHTEEFGRLLRNTCGTDVPRIKSIFDYKSLEEHINEDGCDDIVAVPVQRFKGKQQKEIEGGLTIIPKVDIKDLDWDGIVFCEVLKKCGARERALTLLFAYGDCKFEEDDSASAADFDATGARATTLLQKIFGVRLGSLGDRALESIGLPMRKVVTFLRQISARNTCF